MLATSELEKNNAGTLNLPACHLSSSHSMVLEKQLNLYSSANMRHIAENLKAERLQVESGDM